MPYNNSKPLRSIVAWPPAVSHAPYRRSSFFSRARSRQHPPTARRGDTNSVDADLNTNGTMTRRRRSDQFSQTS